MLQTRVWFISGENVLHVELYEVTLLQYCLKRRKDYSLTHSQSGWSLVSATNGVIRLASHPYCEWVRVHSSETCGSVLVYSVIMSMFYCNPAKDPPDLWWIWRIFFSSFKIYTYVFNIYTLFVTSELGLTFWRRLAWGDILERVSEFYVVWWTHERRDGVNKIRNKTIANTPPIFY